MERLAVSFRLPRSASLRQAARFTRHDPRSAACSSAIIESQRDSECSFGSSSRAAAIHHVGEWLSLVEHLVRDQGVGGSNPLSPTNLSLAYSVIYAAFADASFCSFFGTFGTNEAADGSSKPIPYSSAFFFRNAVLSFTMS